MKLRIREAARILGVSISTLRRWENEGKIQAERTAGGHRVYDMAKLRSIAAHRLPESKALTTLVYVHAPDPESLRQRVARITEYCDRQRWKIELVKDAAVVEQNKSLQLLIQRISSGAAARLVLPSRSDLFRFGSDILLSLCDQFSVEIVIANLPD